MEYYSTHINKLIEQLSHLPGIGAEVGTASGISYYEHAERPGGTAYFFDHRRERKDPLLQKMLYADRSGALPDLQQPQKGCRYDHGRGKYEGSCGIRKNGKI